MKSAPKPGALMLLWVSIYGNNLGLVELTLARQGPNGEKMNKLLLSPRSLYRAGFMIVSLMILASRAAGQPSWRRFLSSPSVQSQGPFPAPETIPPEPSSKQKQELLKSSFEKMKRDADELATLANSLQEDLSKSNQNLLSLKIVSKAERIEKLAKRIKEAAKGH
jgi:hypothetical protein